MKKYIYYPNFEPPENEWLKFSILYLDKFESIILKIPAKQTTIPVMLTTCDLKLLSGGFLCNKKRAE